MLAELGLPAALEARGVQYTVRRATPHDLDALMTLLADDPISSARGDVADAGDREAYAHALVGIIGDSGNDLLLVTDEAGSVISTMQLTRIPGMARRGATRLLIEAVRVRSELRLRASAAR